MAEAAEAKPRLTAGCRQRAASNGARAAQPRYNKHRAARLGGWSQRRQRRKRHNHAETPAKPSLHARGRT